MKIRFVIVMGIIVDKLTNLCQTTETFLNYIKNMKRLKFQLTFIFFLFLTLYGCGDNKTVTLCDCMTKGNEYSTPGTETFQLCEQKLREEFGDWNDLDNPQVRSKYNDCKGRKVI